MSTPRVSLSVYAYPPAVGGSAQRNDTLHYIDRYTDAMRACLEATGKMCDMVQQAKNRLLCGKGSRHRANNAVSAALAAATSASLERASHMAERLVQSLPRPPALPASLLTPPSWFCLSTTDESRSVSSPSAEGGASASSIHSPTKHGKPWTARDVLAADPAGAMFAGAERIAYYAVWWTLATDPLFNTISTFFRCITPLIIPQSELVAPNGRLYDGTVVRVRPEYVDAVITASRTAPFKPVAGTVPVCPPCRWRASDVSCAYGVVAGIPRLSSTTSPNAAAAAVAPLRSTSPDTAERVYILFVVVADPSKAQRDPKGSMGDGSRTSGGGGDDDDDDEEADALLSDCRVRLCGVLCDAEWLECVSRAPEEFPVPSTDSQSRNSPCSRQQHRWICSVRSMVGARDFLCRNTNILYDSYLLGALLTFVLRQTVDDVLETDLPPSSSSSLSSSPSSRCRLRTGTAVRMRTLTSNERKAYEKDPLPSTSSTTSLSFVPRRPMWRRVPMDHLAGMYGVVIAGARAHDGSATHQDVCVYFPADSTFGHFHIVRSEWLENISGEPLTVQGCQAAVGCSPRLAALSSSTRRAIDEANIVAGAMFNVCSLPWLRDPALVQVGNAAGAPTYCTFEWGPAIGVLSAEAIFRVPPPSPDQDAAAAAAAGTDLYVCLSPVKATTVCRSTNSDHGETKAGGTTAAAAAECVVETTSSVNDPFDRRRVGIVDNNNNNTDTDVGVHHHTVHNLSEATAVPSESRRNTRFQDTAHNGSSGSDGTGESECLYCVAIPPGEEEEFDTCRCGDTSPGIVCHYNEVSRGDPHRFEVCHPCGRPRRVQCPQCGVWAASLVETTTSSPPPFSRARRPAPTIHAGTTEGRPPRRELMNRGKRRCTTGTAPSSWRGHPVASAVAAAALVAGSVSFSRPFAPISSLSFPCATP